MKKISIAILTLLVALIACKKVPEVNLKYVDVERDLITVGTTTATVQCDYQYIATLKKAYLYYGEGENEADMNAAEMRVVQNTLYVDLAGLKSNTTYSYFYEFHNGFNSMRTALKTFKTETGNGGGEEPPTPPGIMLPTVITAMVTEITTNSAQCGGEVVNDGGAEVTERGICWGTNENPTLNDSHLAAGMGIGAFTAMMNELEANTTYHVRAYATNEKGTAYGLDNEFITLSGGGSGIPEGAINGLFTINENGDQVYFSRGNLHYQASTNTWRFAENQWDLLVTPEDMTSWYGEYGVAAADVSTMYNSTFNGWIDLFGWGTSGWDNGNVYYQPYNYEISLGFIGSSQYGDGYGPTDGTNYSYDLTGSYANADWGVYNAISNGGNIVNQWRTLTINEWNYIIHSRNTTSRIRFAKATVNNVNGLILLPDDWDSTMYSLSNTDIQGVSWTNTCNTISIADWMSVFETNGAVFLPTAGVRLETFVIWVDDVGYYWSVTTVPPKFQKEWGKGSDAYYMSFGTNHIEMGHWGRPIGMSVRLIHDVNP